MRGKDDSVTTTPWPGLLPTADGEGRDRRRIFLPHPHHCRDTRGRASSSVLMSHILGAGSTETPGI